MTWWDPPRLDPVAKASLEPFPEGMREAMAWLGQYERFWAVSLDRLVALVEADDAP